MKTKTVSTPNEAISLLLKRFDNNRNLHRMTNDQAHQIAGIIAEMDANRIVARTYLPRLRALAQARFIHWLFPRLTRDIEKLDRLFYPSLQEIGEQIAPDPTPFYGPLKRMETPLFSQREQSQ